MQNLHSKRHMFIVFVIAVIGVIGINTWQSSTKNAVAESEQAQILKNITPAEAYALIQEHKDDSDFVILDVRTPREFEYGRIENAINIDYYAETFRDDLNKLHKEKIYLVYCHSGSRSRSVLQIMKELEYHHAYNMLGGIASWYAQNFPVVK